MTRLDKVQVLRVVRLPDMAITHNDFPEMIRVEVTASVMRQARSLWGFSASGGSYLRHIEPQETSPEACCPHRPGDVSSEQVARAERGF